MKKILVVDDDPVLGMMLQEMLEWKGFWVKLLRIPQQTIPVSLEENIDLIVLDKLISGTDGTEVCQDLRNHDVLKDIPVLMITAMHNARESCIAAGASDFITKPFEMDQFLQKINQLVEA